MTKGSALRILLIAIIAINAVVACAAPVHSTPVHPCCPSHPESTPKQCGKLGCFMSDPVTPPPTAQIVDLGTAMVVGTAVQSANQSMEMVAPVVANVHSSGPLFVAFHQLLI